jgi:hypothetical protein
MSQQSLKTAARDVRPEHIVEFKNRQSDQGFYNFNTALQFYNEVTGPTGAFAPFVDVHVVLTRDGTTGQFVGYVNGVREQEIRAMVGRR